MSNKDVKNSSNDDENKIDNSDIRKALNESVKGLTNFSPSNGNDDKDDDS